jgi:hypothetical protein
MQATLGQRIPTFRKQIWRLRIWLPSAMYHDQCLFHRHCLLIMDPEGPEHGPQVGPLRAQTWAHHGPKHVPKHGPIMGPKWSQNGLQNGSNQNGLKWGHMGPYGPHGLGENAFVVSRLRRSSLHQAPPKPCASIDCRLFS